MRLRFLLNPHRARTPPAVSFFEGFQTPAGPKKTRAHPSDRHLKPITKAALGLVGRHVASLGLSGNRNLAVKLGETKGFDYRVILLLWANS